MSDLQCKYIRRTLTIYVYMITFLSYVIEKKNPHSDDNPHPPYECSVWQF